MPAPTIQTAPSPRFLAKQLAARNKEAEKIKQELITSLKPACRALMAGSVSLRQLEDIVSRFNEPEITIDLVIRVAGALVKDGEWLGTDKSPSHRHHRWTRNPDYQTGTASSAPPALEAP